MYLNWSDPETFWLNATNLALGAVVLICLFVVLTAIVRAFMKDAKERKHVSAELDRDMQRLATLGPKGYADSHAFDVPGLGLTMADGGEKLDPSDPKRNKS